MDDPWPQAPPRRNQTNGFGKGRLVTFTYLQNFDCVDQPTMDLDFNGILAQSDSNEMQTPICQAVTKPTQDPTGGSLDNTAHLYVLVPMFGKDKPETCDGVPGLATTRRTLRRRARERADQSIRSHSRSLGGQAEHQDTPS